MPEATSGQEGGGGRSGGARGRVIVAALVVVLAAAAALVYALTRPTPSNRQASTQAATAPATAPATTTSPATRTARKPPRPRGPTTQYLDVLYANYPRMPETRPMEVPLDLSQAARLVLKEPVYLSPGRQDLWITRPDAPPTEAVLARAAKEQGDQLALTVRDVVQFAHWTPREDGPWTFSLVVRGTGGVGYELVTQRGRAPIGTPGREYDWGRALDWNDKVVVPSRTGVSVFEVEPEAVERFQELAPKAEGGAGAPAANLSEPQFLLDWQGLMAWLPWERGKTGGRGAARFVEGKWEPLGPEQGWPEKLVHLMPLIDGSVLQVIARDADQVQVALASLEKLKVDEAEVTKQVEALSDPDENVRQRASKELTRYGPALAPVLEKLVKDQDPETQVRIRQLIKSQVEPTLGGMTLLGDQLRVGARLTDGGAVFYAEAGVMIPGEADTPIVRTPAWLSVRPGQAVELLDPPLTTDLNPDRSRIYAFGTEWIVTNDVRGPQRFVGNGFVPLLRKSEVEQGLVEPLGIDRRGRWLFRKPAKAAGLEQGPAGPAGPATRVAAAPGPVDSTSAPSSNSVSPTLIIDPTLPDPTPRLPVWVYTTAQTVGWDKDNWPVVKNVGAWALAEDHWRALRPKEKMLTKPDEVPPPHSRPGEGTAATSTQAATTTSAATTEATTQSADDLGPPLLLDRDGNRYYDGRSHLKVVMRDGKRTNWALPPAATGGGIAGKIFLVRTDDGLLFLFNQPGRVVRIRPTPDDEEPFTVDATFTRKIPSSEAVTRVWLDPAGRMLMAYENRLAIMFPGGYIPPAIAKLIPAGEADLEEP